MTMSAPAEALFAAELNDVNLIFNRYPANAAGVAVTGDKTNLYKYGAYSKLVAASVIPNPSWVTKIYLDTPTNVQAATSQVFLVELATGATSSEVVVVEDEATLVSLTAVGVYVLPAIILRWTPVVLNSPQINGRIAQGVDASNNWGANMSFQTASKLWSP